MFPATGASSPFIKDEPEDWFATDPSMSNQHNFNMPINVDPTDLQGNHNFANYNFGSQHMSSSFNMGSSMINDDELHSLNLDSSAKQIQNRQNSSGLQPLYNNQPYHSPMINAQQASHIFSGTPNGDPIQSPFLHSFNYAAYNPSMQHLQQQQHMPPFSPTSIGNALVMSREPSYMGRPRTSITNPMTPKTPALAGLHLGHTPESGSMPKPIHNTGISYRHQKSISGQMDSQVGSMETYLGSPLASPPLANHPPIAETLKTGGQSSPPTKIEGHTVGPYQSQEAKRRRRRESHNLVERRRRDNINERIQELAHLVPSHRLEDEKVRKHLTNNTPMSPALVATGLSPPQLTSMAMGSRRTVSVGNITIGLPPEEKDKGPNKGDILNGSVAWTRDLIWALQLKLEQEAQLMDLVRSLGGTWPFGISEDEKRIRTELGDVFIRQPAETFEYSRGHGSGLRVPQHTNIAGEPLVPSESLSPQNMSPGMHPGRNGMHQVGQPQFWGHNNGTRGSLGFPKEEHEYHMDL